MKIKPRNKTVKSVDTFINNADQDHATNKEQVGETQSMQKYKRVTFSLDSDTKDIINKLALKSTSRKTSNSDIVKVAVKYLNGLDDEDFNTILDRIMQ